MRTTRPTAALVACAAGLTIAMVAGCGGHRAGPGVATASGRPTGTAASGPAPAADPAERRLQFLACMRAEGVDLDAGGDRGRTEGTQDDGRVAAALEHCRRYTTGGVAPGRPTAAEIEQMRRYAGCLRDHGLPYYPDPDPETGQPRLSDADARRLKADPLRQAAEQACLPLLPGGVAGGGDANDGGTGGR